MRSVEDTPSNNFISLLFCCLTDEKPLFGFGEALHMLTHLRMLLYPKSAICWLAKRLYILALATTTVWW